MNHSNWFYFLLYVIIIVTAHLVIYGIAEELSISPIAQALQVNHSGLFECTFENDTHNANLKWILSDGTILFNGNTSRNGRFINEDGILKMTDLVLLDSGEYNCEHNEMNLSTVAHLKVYIMPSYLLEGSIVIGINGILFILFIYSMIKTNREQNVKDRMHAF